MISDGAQSCAEREARRDCYKGLEGWVFTRLSAGTPLRKGHWSRGLDGVRSGGGRRGGLPGREKGKM